MLIFEIKEKEFASVLSFIDKGDANDFKMVLKTYFKELKSKQAKVEKSSKASLEIIKAEVDKRLKYSDKGALFFVSYVEELTKLNQIAIEGYEKIYNSFQKLYQDFIREPTAEE